MSGALVPQRLQWGVEQLPPALHLPVLEIGCGAGHAVALLLARYPGAQVTAIDRSAVQITRARARHATRLAKGEIRLELLDLVAAPRALGRHRFGVALAINVNAFWTEPEKAFGAVAELLAPEGRLYLVYEPPTARQHQQRDGRTDRAAVSRSPDRNFTRPSLVRKDIP